MSPPKITIAQENKTAQFPPQPPPGVANQKSTAWKELKGKAEAETETHTGCLKMSRNGSQDWLERFGYKFKITSLGISLPAYSETLVRIPTTEEGNRLFEAQELQVNVSCASSVVGCKDSSFFV